MNTYLYCGEINGQGLTDFLAWVDQIPDGTPAHLYLNSEGGFNYVGEIMVDVLNKYLNITVHAGPRISSMAFILFFKINNPRVFMDAFVYGMIHHGNIEVDSIELNDPLATRGKLALTHVNRTDDYYNKEMRPYLSDAEYERFIVGEDIYIDLERMRKMLEEDKLFK